MSEVAGRMATINGAYYLQKNKGGKGKLISGVPGVNRTKVLILGGGTVGEAAARMAAGLGADVWITDISLPPSSPTGDGTTYQCTYTLLQ